MRWVAWGHDRIQRQSRDLPKTAARSRDCGTGLQRTAVRAVVGTEVVVVRAIRLVAVGLLEVAAMVALADVILALHVRRAGALVHARLARASAAVATLAADRRHVT